MNKKAIGILEYNKIKELLENETDCRLTKNCIKDLKPITDYEIIDEELRSTTEGVDLILHKGNLPLGTIPDVIAIASFARKGGCLTMRQLLEIHYILAVTDNVIKFMSSEDNDFPIIKSYCELLVSHETLEREIDRCIISEDEMADNASPKLRSIRRKIVIQNDAIKRKLNKIITSPGNKAYLQDSIVTIKDGRYVVPVKLEHKSKFPGIIHDQSKGGATLFIEPQAIVTMNNELRELELEEQVEISRILQKLSDNVGECFHDISHNQKNIVQLDYIMAKAKLSIKMKAFPPKISKGRELILKDARHPLIDREKVVPICVNIGKDYQTLVITGPNTGGKTVTLKTIGLLVLMAQSGLHIPASEDSVLPIYDNIFADIGDEQSIEQNLSTFSSHMKNLVNILDEVDEKSLVLLDELGAGTDPTEGAALAISILETLFKKGSQTVATTHYNELKKYALSTDKVQNASMEFDVATLRPTYRLRIGAPGKSNAFEISRKLGLPKAIIERSNELIQSKDMEFQDVISAIDREKVKVEVELKEAKEIKKELEEARSSLKKEKEDFEREKEKILDSSKEQARTIIKEAKDMVKDVRKSLRNIDKIENFGEKNKIYDESRTKLKNIEDQYDEVVVSQVNNKPVKASTLKIGDRVKVMTLNQNGEIVSLPNSNGDLQVQIGMLKANVNVRDVMILNTGKASKNKKSFGSKKYGNLIRNKAMSISSSINVQGENMDNAIMDVEKYIDDAFMAGLSEVTIIHGRGQGILRSGIRKALRKNKNVDAFRAGVYNEGGEGITIVKLKSK